MKFLFLVLISSLAITGYICIIRTRLKNENKVTLLIAYSALLLAALGHVSALYSSIFRSSIEVLSLTPVCVVDDFDVQFDDDSITFYNVGMYLVVELQNGNHPSYISSIEITGRIPVQFNQYLSCNIGMTIQDISKEYEASIPYFQISWVAWPYEQEGEIKLEKDECSILIFELWEPISSGQREIGYLEPMNRYFGNSEHQPDRFHGYPSVEAFCELEILSGGIPTKVRSVFYSDSVDFRIRSGDQYFEVPRGNIDELIGVWLYEWDNQHISRILHAGDEIRH